ncbi:hypothetical protein ACFYXH_22340 [Streptomyces sp. NPDC002730]|uniref:hypothetical protein n=1 Tax=Streptomyces sp. NPDC002730 TaxID=3364662 RepID=UPI0036C96F79
MGLVLTGVPGLTGEAGAAPRPPKPLDPGMPCKDYYDLADDIQAIAELPEFDASRAKSQWDTYEYENPGKKWDGLGPPSQADIDRLENLEKQPPKSKPIDRVYWTWLQARKSNANAWGDWSHWRDIRLIRNAGNDPRGKAFEKKVIKDHGLTGPEWICQKEVEFKAGHRHNPPQVARRLQHQDRADPGDQDQREARAHADPQGQRVVQGQELAPYVHEVHLRREAGKIGDRPEGRAA